MTLSLLHPWIAGLAVAAVTVPIIIHLLLRQKPKPIVFPAMVLLRKRHQQTIRRLRVRHWLLLALRCLLLLLLGLALARPTLRSSVLSVDQEAPIAAVLVFDDSPSMQRKERGQTRLQLAQELAATAIQRLPEGSEISVLDASNPVPSAPLGRAAATDRVNGIQTQWVPRTVNEAIAAAIRSASQSTQERREIYVFSDQAVSAWNLAEADVLANLMKEVDPPISMYILDVHSENLDNVSIEEVQLSSQVVPSSADLALEVVVRNRGPAVDNALRLVVDGEPRGEKALRLTEGQSATVPFQVPGLSGGLHQGEVLLAANDAMPFDDRRFFTIDVRPPPRVLIVVDDPADSLYWSKALVPDADVAEQRPRYKIDRIESSRLEETSLEGYQVVALVNAGQVSQSGWLRLTEFVQRGGGLFVAVGPRVTAEVYNSIAAQQVLPGRLNRVVESSDVALVTDQRPHPVLEPFARFGGSDLGDWAVLRYWNVEPTPGSTVVVLGYTNGDAGLIERSFGEGNRGKSMLLTTAAHYTQEGEPWSEIPLGWSYVVLAEEITQYLAGTAEVRLNYQTGQPVAVPRSPSDGFVVYAITDPAEVVERVSVAPRSTQVDISALRLPGQYRVDASHAGRSFTWGFSANIASSESSIEPIGADRMREIFGEETVAVARDPSELQRIEGASRVGRELFPWLMALLAVAICVEGLLSNRFYRAPTQPQATG